MKNLTFIALLIALILSNIAQIRLKKKYTEAYESACVMSDIIRLHLDEEEKCDEFEELYHEVVDNIECYNLHIDTLDLSKYSWCY